MKFGKPIISRTLTYETNIETAIKIAYLAFDSTRVNAIDVDFPIDIVISGKNSFEIREYRLSQDEMSEISAWWQEKLRGAVEEIPSDWVSRILEEKKFAKAK